PFKPDCIAVIGQDGERRIDNIAFRSPQDNYVIGNDMDKLLSGAKIIYDKNGQMQKILDTLWLSVTKKLIEHRRKHRQPIDPYHENIAPLLFRYDRFSADIKEDIKQKTCSNILLNLELEQKKVKRGAMMEHFQDMAQAVRKTRRPYVKPEAKEITSCRAEEILSLLQGNEK
ncbi:MAG: hypothetical protein J5895_02665, partial [Alphaproteobacteria bacterium]|nr:hypothetical protein [Alphaproteobacteria bacterium]